MLILSEMKFKNVFSYGNKWEHFTFENGLSFITGKNLNTNRRNFTGKSSLLKIIPFALFGKVDGLTKNQIVNWKNKKNAEVILKFQKGDDNYTIHRGIKPDKFSVLKNDKELPISSNKKTFQEELEETVLGIDFDTFMNICYCDTNNMVSILNATKPVKRDYIEKLFNLSYFVNLKKKSDEKKKDLNNELLTLNGQLSSLTESNQSIKNNIEKYNEDQKVLHKKLDSLKVSKTEINIKEIDNKINELKESIDKNKKLKQSLSEQKLKNDLLIGKIKTKIKYLMKFEPRKQNTVDLTKKIKETTIGIEKLQTLKKSYDIESLQGENKELQSFLKDNEQELYKLQVDLKNVNKIIVNTSKELENKPKTGKCPTCLQEVDFKHIEDELNEIIDEKFESKRQIESSILTVKETIKSFKEKISVSDTKIKDYHDIIENINELQTNLKQYEKDQIEYKNWLDEKNKYTRYLKAIKKQKVVYTNLTENTFEDDINSLTNEIIKYETELNKKVDLKNEYDSLDADIKSVNEQIIIINGYKENSVKELKDSEIKFKGLQKKKNQYNTAIEYLKELSNLCGDDKCKQYAISSYLPYFNERVNYYLNLCGVKFYIKIFGWLDYEIKGPGITDCKYSNLSGAEKISVDRSIQLASIDVKKSQSSELIDLLIFDEVLDSSLDNDGLIDMMQIIKNKQVQENLKILIVSHKNELGNLNELFDYKYLVENDGNYSKIKGE